MLNVLLFTECDIQSKSLLYTRERVSNQMKRSFERASPRGLVTGQQADLSDITIRRD